MNTPENTTKSTNTKQLAMMGLMAALCCILGPLSIPLPMSPVPISLTSLSIYLSLYVLGMKRGTVSYIIYMLLGLAGLPVFSSFTGGPSKLFGPTGGYIIGFIFLAVICGLFIDRWPSNYFLCLLGMVLGMTVCYIFGTLWLAYQMEQTFFATLSVAVIPFLPGDFIKMIMILVIGPILQKRLKKAGAYPS